MTARPLAPVELAPSAPTVKRPASSAANPVVNASPAGHHRALADPIGQDPPRDGRDHHADRERGDRQADLAQVQRERVAQLRTERGEAHAQPGERRRAERAHRQDDPAVARAQVRLLRRHVPESSCGP
jgi:hypothetical protein